MIGALVALLVLLIVIVQMVRARKRLAERHVSRMAADYAASYKHGLQAVLRLQRAAYDMERQMFMEAIAHAELESTDG